MKVHKNHLKLQKVKKEDTGVFHCRAVNGFGSVSVRVELIITNPKPSHDNLNLLIAAPMFTKRTISQPTNMLRQPGESMELSCYALGNPTPKVSWLQNENPIAAGPSLILNNLRPSNSGLYTCLATNLAGTINRQFNLTVQQENSKKVELPTVSEMKNVSVQFGDDSFLKCEVTSNLTPSIQWLRETEMDESIRLAGMNLVNVADGDTVKVGDTNYMSTLVISSATLQDSGVYVCFVTNNAGGFNYQSFF